MSKGGGGGRREWGGWLTLSANEHLQRGMKSSSCANFGKNFLGKTVLKLLITKTNREKSIITCVLKVSVPYDFSIDGNRLIFVGDSFRVGSHFENLILKNTRLLEFHKNWAVCNLIKL